MTIAELTPDTALAALLDGKVEVQTSATEKHTIRAYEQTKMPNKGLADEFITIQNNGVITSRTKPFGLYVGNLALTIYCKSNTDGTAKTNRLRQMVAQCELIVNGKVSDGFFFEFDATNVITPPTSNDSTGYATTTLNVAWHTANKQN